MLTPKNNKRPAERYGHTSGIYKGMFIIFGGELKYNPEIKMRETLCDIWMYSLQHNEFKLINPGNKVTCEPRKDHAMAIVGNHILIQGGINMKGHFTDNPIVYDFCN